MYPKTLISLFLQAQTPCRQKGCLGAPGSRVEPGIQGGTAQCAARDRSPSDAKPAFSTEANALNSVAAHLPIFRVINV